MKIFLALILSLGVSQGADRLTNAFAVRIVQASGNQRLTPLQLAATSRLSREIFPIGWSKFRAVYPFVGGAATAHSINLVSPTTNQITWFGTVTHNATGITGDGTTGYGSTGIGWNTMSATYALAVNATANGTALYDSFIGVTDNTSASVAIGSNFVVTGTDFYQSASATSIAVTRKAFPAFHAVVRTTTAEWRAYRNSTLEGTVSQTATNPFETTAIAVLALGFTGGGAIVHTDGGVNFALISNVLTAAEVASFSTAVQRYQVALRRQAP